MSGSDAFQTAHQAGVVEGCASGPSPEEGVSLNQFMAYAKDLARLYQLEKEREEDLRAGALMQARFLTPVTAVDAMFAPAGYRASVINHVSTTVSGDFFYPTPLGEAQAGFFLGDACGHGLSAALISMRIASLIQTAASDHSRPEAFLEAVNGDICGLMPAGFMVAGAYGVFRPEGVHLAGAGLPYPFLMSGGQVREVELPGMPLGLACGTSYTGAHCPMVPGDKLILFSDGLTEIVNEHEEPFGPERVAKWLTSCRESCVETLAAALVETVFDYAGDAGCDDDLTVAVIERVAS